MNFIMSRTNLLNIKEKKSVKKDDCPYNSGGRIANLSMDYGLG